MVDPNRTLTPEKEQGPTIGHGTKPSGVAKPNCRPIDGFWRSSFLHGKCCLVIKFKWLCEWWFARQSYVLVRVACRL